MQLINKKALDFREQARNLRSIKGIVLCGLFLALYIVIYALKIPITPTNQVRFGFIALAAASLYGGPLMGLTIGILGDLLSMLLAGGQGAYFFGFTLSYALMGFFFGFILFGVKITPIRAIVAGLVEFIIAMLLNSYWLSILSGTPYKVLLITRAPKCILTLVISSILLYILLNSLKTIINKLDL